MPVPVSCTAKSLVANGSALKGIPDIDVVITYLLCQWAQSLNMSVSCNPQTLATQAKAFAGLEPMQREAVQTYLLALIAGGSTDPKVLAKAAAIYDGIPFGLLKRVQTYLLCQAA